MYTACVCMFVLDKNFCVRFACQKEIPLYIFCVSMMMLMNTHPSFVDLISLTFTTLCHMNLNYLNVHDSQIVLKCLRLFLFLLVSMVLDASVVL